MAPTVVLGRGEGYDALRVATLAAPRPGLAVMTVPGEGVADDVGERYPLLAGKRSEGGAATAWVCRHGTCRAPVTDVAGLAGELAD